MGVLKTKNLAYEIADVLGDRIIRIEMKPGERILEARIATEFNVSQSSVREALRILEQRSLVEISQRRGTYVTGLTVNDIDILYDLISEMYVILIRKAMEKKSDENVMKIQHAVTKIENAAGRNDSENYFSRIFEFAMIAIDVINSPLLKKMITDSWHNKRRVEYMTLALRKHELKKNLKYFKLLEKYMIESNIEKLVKTIRDYMQNEKKFAIKHIKKIIETRKIKETGGEDQATLN